MKKRLFLLILTACLTTLTKAQTARLDVFLKNSTAIDCSLLIPAKRLHGDFFKQGYLNIKLTKGKGSIVVKLDQPVFAYLMYQDNETKNAKHHKYKLYVSNNYHLKISADAGNGTVTVNGTGSNNNQPLLGHLVEPDLDSLRGDTTPNRSILITNRHQKNVESAYNQYLKKYNPSTDFIKNERQEIAYSTLNSYYYFKEDNRYYIRKAYNTTQPLWESIQDSLLNVVKLDNSNALVAANYLEFLRTYFMREKSRLRQEAHDHPISFFKEYYDADTVTGNKLYMADVQNLLGEKIIVKHFSGAVAEHVYALLLDDALIEHDYRNLVSIYDRFRKKYPQSRYQHLFDPEIDKVRKAEKNVLTSDMVFLPRNGTNLNSFQEVLTLAKGKTVLLDMWGTWCAPCRMEISTNGVAIKKHFKDKGLNYFYVANRDLDHVEEWKKLIAYFDMKGTHILASTALNKDIMKTVKGGGYPTYVIIKKNGSWELSEAGYPMNQDILIKQLEAALAL